MGKAVRRVRGESQKLIVKMLEGLAGRYAMWDIWQDFIIMTACTYSNCIKHPYWDEREKMYLERAKKYSKEELEVFAQAIAEMVMAFDSNTDQDFLGELFMSLELGSKWHGQFFTPYSICQMMAQITFKEDAEKEIEENGFISVNDPACGAGALLIAFASECTKRKINYQQSVMFVGQDVDLLAGCMCYIQLSLLGCPGYVCIDNTLTNPCVAYDRKGLLPKDRGNIWYTPMFNSDLWMGRRLCAKLDLMMSSNKTEGENNNA